MLGLRALRAFFAINTIHLLASTRSNAYLLIGTQTHTTISNVTRCQAPKRTIRPTTAIFFSSKISPQTKHRREYLLGLFDYVEKLQPSNFRASTRAAFELGLQNGAFDEEKSPRGMAMESELFAAIGKSAAIVTRSTKKESEAFGHYCVHLPT